MAVLTAAVNWMLARRWVQYILLGAVVVLFIAASALTITYRIQTSRLQAAREKIKGTEAQVELQNQGILQLQREGAAAQKKAVDAQVEAVKISRRYEARVRELLKQPAPADCEEARQYGFELARQLVGGDK